MKQYRFAITLVCLLLGAQGFADNEPSVQFKFAVKCENPSNCPSNVGLLLHASGMCTTFLISHDVVATNRHCLPPDVDGAGANCAGKIEVIFPKNANYQEERLQCERVLAASDANPDENAIVQDYALLKLQSQTERTPFVINRNGLADRQMVTIYKMTRVPNQSEALLSSTSCRAVLRSVLNPFYIVEQSPIVYMSPCQIVKGNSGSPIVDDRGMARGVISAKWEFAPPSDLGLQNNVTSVSRAMGSSFACIPLDSIDMSSDMPSVCRELNPKNLTVQEARNKMINVAVQAAAPQAIKKYQSMMLALHKSTLLTIRWKLIHSGSGADEKKRGVLDRFKPMPDCILPTITRASLESYLNDKRDKMTIPFVYTSFAITADYDSDSRLFGRVQPIRQPGFLHVDPGALKGSGEGVFTLELGAAMDTAGKMIFHGETTSYHLKECKLLNLSQKQKQ